MSCCQFRSRTEGAGLHPASAEVPAASATATSAASGARPPPAGAAASAVLRRAAAVATARPRRRAVLSMPLLLPAPLYRSPAETTRAGHASLCSAGRERLKSRHDAVTESVADRAIPVHGCG